ADSARNCASRRVRLYRPCWRSAAAAPNSSRQILDWTSGPPSCVHHDLIPEPSLLLLQAGVRWGSRAPTAAAIDVRPTDFETIPASEQAKTQQEACRGQGTPVGAGRGRDGSYNYRWRAQGLFGELAAASGWAEASWRSMPEISFCRI